MKLFKGLAIAATALGLLASAPVVQAKTVATVDIGGAYAFGSATGGGTTITMSGDWSVAVPGPIPSGERDYTFSANVEVTPDTGGPPAPPLLWSDSIGPVRVDFGDVIDTFDPIVTFLINNAGVPQSFGFGTLTYDGTLDALSTASLAFGTWTLTSTIFVPAGPLPVATMVNPMMQNSLLGNALRTDPQAPNLASGTFNVGLSASVSPVPLPAAGVLLLAALGGIGLMRARRKQIA